MSVLERPKVPPQPTSIRVGSSTSVLKRAIDVVGAGAGLILLAPLLVVVGLIVVVSSRGGALYRQRRVGLGGRTFSMVKFRTMQADSDAHLAHLKLTFSGPGLLFKLVDDPRVTPVGRFLRRFSIDELPQLWNVLVGDMSLVGPRPALECEVDEYCSRARRRLGVPPGMTGAWQVGGRSTLDWQAGLDLDLHYVDNWSLRYDAVLLLKTVRAVVAPVGAY
jgi:lipopolysaccharide/colanic/teichoic acid biosynthesis glycosyltransferase